MAEIKAAFITDVIAALYEKEMPCANEDQEYIKSQADDQITEVWRENPPLFEALQYKITFGKKYAGRYLGAVWIEDRAYVEWIAKNFDPGRVKDMAALIIAENWGIWL